MKEVKYTFHSDSSHGWGKISTAALRKYCQDIVHKISKYSYITDNYKYVYLEEDCDLPIVINHLRINNIEVKCTKEINTNSMSSIRNRSRFKANYVYHK